MTDQRRDHVEREIVIRAPIERAFAALTDPALYPTWGPERVEGILAAGERPILDFGAGGGGKVAVYVVAVEAPRYFAYRWKQGETDPARLLDDPLAGPNTLVEFHLETIEAGTRVRVVESGLASLPGLPGVDRDTAIEHMGEGWRLMLGGLARFLTTGPLTLQDRIENELVVPAPRADVFAALTHPERWWAEKVEGALVPGQQPVVDFGMFGRIRFAVIAADAPDYFAYRWVQGVDDPARRVDDPRTSPSTLVEYHLDDAPGGGTRVRQAESGFTALPGDDLLRHYKRAHQVWGIILGMLGKHFARS
ncbi:MAG TPA: SRPBCC domain-containing protein [Kofleriaceae bacterium]|jgi:uncharacterized protein YndB with AHSA1/START domain|nr:SRPBCC domain-containing protein [Kofleriaceae bacterium]